jgi:hypothetical protein
VSIRTLKSAPTPENVAFRTHSARLVEHQHDFGWTLRAKPTDLRWHLAICDLSRTIATSCASDALRAAHGNLFRF